MSPETSFETNQKKRANGLIVEPDCGWVGPKPANTKTEKINQIKTEYVDSRALLVKGATVADFYEFPFIPAHISVQDLIRCVDELGKHKSFTVATGKKKSFLVVQDLDKLPESEQEKFIPLLKDKQILSSKLPDKMQILFPVTDENSVSQKIKSLTFLVKVA